MNDRVIVLLLAVALDLLVGEPPALLHPVVWMGRYIGWGERRAPVAWLAAMFLFGTVLTALGLVVVAATAFGIGLLLDSLPRLAYLFPTTPGDEAARVSPYLLHGLGLLAGAWLLKTTFAGRALAKAAHAVQHALERGDLPEARRLLSWHLVSRDTSALGAGLVAAATIESVAENFSDSLVAPLLFFALFGVPGALAYRFANTSDAMLGYRDVRREYLGKFAARLDDALNLVPARLSALLLLAAAVLTKAGAHDGWQRILYPLHRHADDVRPSTGWRVMWRDHSRTASPNAGWPMSAMAGILGVTLEKVGYYQLGDGPAPDAQDIGRSLRVAAAAALLWVILLGLAIFWIH